MRTEHLQNVHAGWVVAGWLVAAAVTSLVLIALAGLGIVGAGDMAPGWSLLAVLAGFYVGGMFTGFRSIDAPILHGIAIGIFSLVAWLVLNVIATAFFPEASWQTLSPTASSAILLLQLAAAVGGAWTGHVIALRGGPDVTD